MPDNKPISSRSFASYVDLIDSIFRFSNFIYFSNPGRVYLPRMDQHPQAQNEDSSAVDVEKVTDEDIHAESGNSRSKNNNLVEFARDDPSDPRNWPSWRKWSIVVALTIANFSVIWNASGYTTAQMQFESEFGTSAEVSVLPLSLYVIGVALGCMVLAPLSEYYGRTPIYLGSFLGTVLFLMATALVKSTAGFIILRFITGFMCSASVGEFSKFRFGREGANGCSKYWWLNRGHVGSSSHRFTSFNLQFDISGWFFVRVLCFLFRRPDTWSASRVLGHDGIYRRLLPAALCGTEGDETQ